MTMKDQVVDLLRKELVGKRYVYRGECMRGKQGVVEDVGLDDSFGHIKIYFRFDEGNLWDEDPTNTENYVAL